ncbi:isoprenylcysteine carboxylmethyltransferase family protein [bacterium]|nr:isoprenylcysteine carboxylmethyltransferase family protein [bacterium]
MFNSSVKIVCFIGILIMTVVRTACTGRYRTLQSEEKQSSAFDTILLAFSGVGMIVPVVYVLSPLLDFADYRVPAWFPPAGMLLFLPAIFLLWRSHADLGGNWTPVLSLRKDHHLVTGGIYRHIRHPMYTAHLLWGLAQVLLLPNWIAGYALLAAVLPQVLLRIGAEERMMVRRFGGAYRTYQVHTGMLLPELFSSRARR